MTLLFCMAVLVAPASAERVMKHYDSPRIAPDFALPSTQGGVRRLSDYRGQFVLVNFWAVWCSPCRKEMPSMQRAYDQLKGDRFTMVAIHVGPTLAGARSYAEKLGLHFDILVDEEMALSGWQVMGLPTTFLVDPQGMIVAEAVGERDWAGGDLMDQLQGVLGVR